MNKILIDFLITIVPPLTALIIAFLTAKTREIIKRTNNTVLEGYFDDLNKAITDNVMYVAQTFTDSLKKDGKFNVDKQKEALQEALNGVLSDLDKRGKAILQKATGDLESYIIKRIEKEVLLLKEQRA